MMAVHRKREREREREIATCVGGVRARRGRLECNSNYSSVGLRCVQSVPRTGVREIYV